MLYYMNVALFNFFLFCTHSNFAIPLDIEDALNKIKEFIIFIYCKGTSLSTKGGF